MRRCRQATHQQQGVWKRQAAPKWFLFALGLITYPILTQLPFLSPVCLSFKCILADRRKKSNTGKVQKPPEIIPEEYPTEGKQDELRLSVTQSQAFSKPWVCAQARAPRTSLWAKTQHSSHLFWHPVQFVLITCFHFLHFLGSSQILKPTCSTYRKSSHKNELPGKKGPSQLAFFSAHSLNIYHE